MAANDKNDQSMGPAWSQLGSQLVANLEANLEPTWCQLGSNRRLSFRCCRMWEKDKPFGHPAGIVETRADNDRGRTLRFFLLFYLSFTSHHLNMLAVQTPNS